MVANGISNSNKNRDDFSDGIVVNRPPNIEQDMKEMERRKRVKMIIESQIFKDELERIIESQLNESYLPSTLSALHQVTELISPKSGLSNSFAHNITIPVNDIRGIDAFKYDKNEKNLRCKLASVYRLVDLYGWSQIIYNHISVRINQENEHFLINPFGLQYQELTASSLIKIDLQGNTIDPGSTNFSFNRAGFVLHSAIHSARPDIKAIIHMHYPPCVAVSALKHGLLCICQEAAIIGDVSYHDYKGLAVENNLRELVSKDLGPLNKVLILRNHGVITCGESLEEALYLMHNLVKACETQIKLEPIDLNLLHEMSEESKNQVRSIVKNFGTAVQGKPENEKSNSEQDNKTRIKKWKIWDLEFESQMRMLDNAGYRTGYIYRQPLLRASHLKSNRIGSDEMDIEIPPAAQNHLVGNLFDENWLTPLKTLVNYQQKKERVNWVNTPNSYQKVESNDNGLAESRRVSKWINSTNGSLDGPISEQTVKIDPSHQFIPVNENGIREFQNKQQKMKEYRRQNQISEGPTSRILEANMNDNIEGFERKLVIGAASKGIIQKEYQNNAKIYKTFYEKNPFDNINYQELEDYTCSIIGKNKGSDHDQANTTIESNNISDLNDSKLSNGNKVQRSHSARLAAQATEDSYFTRKFQSERKPKLKRMSETDIDEEGNDSSKEMSISEKSSKKDKKKKGFRAPSFLKKNKKNKKEVA